MTDKDWFYEIGFEKFEKDGQVWWHYGGKHSEFGYGEHKVYKTPQEAIINACSKIVPIHPGDCLHEEWGCGKFARLSNNIIEHTLSEILARESDPHNFWTTTACMNCGIMSNDEYFKAPYQNIGIEFNPLKIISKSLEFDLNKICKIRIGDNNLE